MPERIQLRRTLGWRKPEGAIVVARPSRWGNPFKVGMVIDRISLIRRGVRTVAEVRIETRRQAVDIHRRWLDGAPFLTGGHDLAPLPPTVAEIKTALRGHDLACWCPLGPCHADVLLELANA